MFCDQTKVKFTGGDGGDGCVSFRREKYVAKGGPDGGDGGKGGNIILMADSNINTLAEFNKRKKFQAENGTVGHKKNQTGNCGSDLILKVPIGTMLFETGSQNLITDLSTEKQQFLIAKGGKGGLGNARFVNSVHQAPKFAEKGEKGEEIEVEMELKVVAEIGIIGMPSSGKSTLISRISNARPKIAAYHFTTLIPNLGIVELSQFGGSIEQTLVVADIPGLIPGAHLGKGLGHDFLRHISRTHILVHLLDGTLENVVEAYKNINKELELYDKQSKIKSLNSKQQPLSQEEQIVVINKIDISIPEIVEDQIKQLEKSNPKLKGKIHAISAASGEGIKELIWDIWKAKEHMRHLQEEQNLKNKVTTADSSEEYKVFRPHLESQTKSFKISLLRQEEYIPSEQEHLHGNDITPQIRRTWQITGERIEQIANMTDWSNQEAIERIYRYMNTTGVQKTLKRQGAANGDIIEISKNQLKFRT